VQTLTSNSAQPQAGISEVGASVVAGLFEDFRTNKPEGKVSFTTTPSRPTVRLLSVRFYPLASASPPLPRVLGPSIGNSLPLEIGDRIGTTAGEGHDVIFPITGTTTARAARGRAWMLALELACDRT
jgi:hypothetical protein